MLVVRIVWLALLGCSASAPSAKLQRADRLLGDAEALEHAGRAGEAIEAYLAIPSRVVDDDVTAATASYRAGTLLLRAGEVRAAWEVLWRTVTDWPDEPVAGDALGVLLADGRRRDPRALADQLHVLANRLVATEVGDNLFAALADLDEHELANPASARALWDRVPQLFPAGGFRDDARWQAARLSRALGDPHGAVARLRALLGTREVARITGSYFSVWLDQAQLELGTILRDDLRDHSAAAAAFRRLPRDYPASVLRDDALYELAVTLAQAGDAPGACTALRDLRKLDAESKYVARPLASELHCR